MEEQGHSRDGEAGPPAVEMVVLTGTGGSSVTSAYTDSRRALSPSGLTRRSCDLSTGSSPAPASANPAPDIIGSGAPCIIGSDSEGSASAHPHPHAESADPALCGDNKPAETRVPPVQDTVKQDRLKCKELSFRSWTSVITPRAGLSWLMICGNECAASPSGLALAPWPSC